MQNQTSRTVVNRRSGTWLAFAGALILLVVWLSLTPTGLLGKADAIGYAVCHRIEVRSFHLGTRPLPLCARCSGMYLGAMLALLFQTARGRRAGMPPKRILLVFGVFTLFFIVDGLNSFLSLFPGFPGLYTPSNTLRLIAGTGMGFVIAGILLPVYNETVWRDYDPRPAIGNFRDLAVLVLLGVLLDWLILSENPLVLYPLALISAAGVVVLLTMIYALAFLILTKQANRSSGFAHLLLPLLVGFTLALAQIALLDLGRYLLTGTWEGFHFG